MALDILREHRVLASVDGKLLPMPINLDTINGRSRMLAGHGYPRPQLRRTSWNSLNGTWSFALDPNATWKTPEEVVRDRAIEVPFSPETEWSGVEWRERERALPRHLVSTHDSSLW